MLTKEVKDLYVRFRQNPPFMRVGHNAADALSAARTIARFRQLEADGKVRLRVEFDDDCDVSWMDDKQREEWDGEEGFWMFETISGVCHDAFESFDDAVEAAKQRFGFD